MERSCGVCDKIIIIKPEFRSSGRARKSENYFSEDGTLFKKAWFCNKCWGAIIKMIEQKEEDKK